MVILKTKSISWLIALVAISFLSYGCFSLQDIEWETKPLAGEVLGTHATPRQHGAPIIKVAIKLDSGELVLVRPLKDAPIIKGQKLELYRGRTQLGQKIYSLASPDRYPSPQ